MAIPKEIVKFLDEEKIKYEPVEHRTVYTAFDKAATLRVPPKTIGKTLVVKFGRDYGLVLISAQDLLDKVKFKKVVNKWLKAQDKKAAKSIDFVKESWMKKNLKGVKIGAISPFGKIWGLPTFVEKSFFQNRQIIVNGGDYTFSIKISQTNLKKVKDLIIGSFGKKRPKKKKKKKK